MASFSSSSSSIATFIKFLLGAFFLLAGIASAQLSPSNFYGTSCPNALSVIKSAVTTAVSNEARMGASLLRLHFHDCFVNGCDASVLLDGGEKTAPPNANSLRGFEVIDNIKSQLETSCRGVVSCADILAVAARDSVVALSGRGWEVRLGRRDSATAGSVSDVTNNIPSPAMSLSALITSFSNKGFTAKEMVALSGSHTIGQARCTTFSTRLNNETNIDASFKTSTQAKCSNSNNFVELDVTSPNAFDNAYFTNLVGQKGLLHSDQQLFSGGSTDAQVRAYSSNPGSFMTDFGNAMIKMGNLSPLTGSNGQIRTNCRKAN